MNKKYRNLINKIRGFTLIELLVGVAIVAMLTAIVIVNISGSRAKARDTVRLSDLAQIQMVLQRFYERCNQYPTSLDLNASDGCPAGVTLRTYISQIPTPPAGVAGQNNYGYTYLLSLVTGRTLNYVLHVTLENGGIAGSKGLSAMPSAPSRSTWNASFTCSNTTTSVDYCVSAN